MILKILAVISLAVLPLSASLWHKSHANPEHYRYDVTLYKSLRVYLKDGKCSLRLFNMPTKTACPSGFRGPLKYDPPPTRRALLLSSQRRGPYRISWLVFPLWLSTGVLTLFIAIPIARGPVRRLWRSWHGWCLECGYDLRGTRSRRCPECGTRFR